MGDERVAELVRRIGGFGAPGAAPSGPIEVEDPAWPRLLGRLQGQRITGLAMAALESGELRLSDEQAEELADRHREAMVWSLIVERTLLEVAGDLVAAGVDFILLKGASIAHTMYPDPSWRSFGDVDLLVRSRDWHTARAVFEGRGFPRELPEPRAGFDERFGKAAVFQSQEGVQIDLHLRLVLGPFGLWIETEELFDRTTPLAIGGTSVPRLQDTELLLSVCVHAALGASPPLPVPLRDVLQVATVGKIDWTRFRSLAQDWTIGGAVGYAMRAASDMYRAQLPAGTAGILADRPSRRELRLLGAYTERGGRGGIALSTLAAVPDVRSKLSYVRALLLPDQQFLTARRGGEGRGLSLLRRWGGTTRWIRVRTGTRSDSNW